MTASKQADPFGLAGRTLAGKYEIEELVEETALSVVYRAVHRLLHRPVAIKVFKAPPQSGLRRALVEGFVREGTLLMELSERSTGVCQARDVAAFTIGGGLPIPYIVLEWLEGEPLDVLLKRERAQETTLRTVGDSMRLLGPVAKALSLAHDRGVVHRDVKPGNVFVMREGRGCKLIDFGSATLVDELSRASALYTFTPEYGAPEQFSREHGEVGPWTDVYALALILVELLSGREALGADDLATLACASCDPSHRPTPRARGAHVSAAVEAVFLRATALRPEHRLASVKEFWIALKAAAGQRASGPDTTLPIDLRRVRSRQALDMLARAPTLQRSA